MKYLAIDTTDEAASCALLDENRIISEVVLNIGMKRHSVTLMPMVDYVMKVAGTKPEELYGIICATGPGSFTGIRIGVTAAKTMAYALGIKVAEVNSLDALAFGCISSGAKGLICPMIDARNRQVYTAIYSVVTKEFGEALPARVSDYLAVPVEQLEKEIISMADKLGSRNVVLTGNGLIKNFEFWRELNKKILPYNIILKAADTAFETLRAGVAGRLGLLENKFKEPSLIMPFYLRKTQAERMKEKSEKSGSENKSEDISF